MRFHGAQGDLMRTERYPAKVVSVGPPLATGEFEVTCLGLTGDPGLKLPVPVIPVQTWGWFAIPDVGEVVEIEVVVGDELDESPSQSFVEDLEVVWTGRRFAAEGEAEARPIASVFSAKNYGKRRGFATPAGHYLLFDDTEGDESVQLLWKGSTSSFLSFDKDGSVILANKDGQNLLFMDAKNSTVSVVDEHSNVISLDSSGAKVVGQGSWLEIIGNAVNIVTGGHVSVSGTSVDVANGADQKAVRGDELITWITGTLIPMIQAITVPTAFGPSGVPINAAALTPPPATVLSTVVKVK